MTLETRSRTWRVFDELSRPDGQSAFLEEPLKDTIIRQTSDLHEIDPQRIFSEHLLPGLLERNIGLVEDHIPLVLLPVSSTDVRPVICHTIGAFARYPKVSKTVGRTYRYVFADDAHTDEQSIPNHMIGSLPQPHRIPILQSLIAGSHDVDTYFVIPDKADILSHLLTLKDEIQNNPLLKLWRPGEKLDAFQSSNSSALVDHFEIFTFGTRGYALRHHLVSNHFTRFHFTHDMVFMRKSASLAGDMRLGTHHGHNQRYAKKILEGTDGQLHVLYDPSHFTMSSLPESIENPHYETAKEALIAALRIMKPIIKQLPESIHGWIPLEQLILPESVTAFRRELKRLLDRGTDLTGNSFYDNEIVLQWMDMCTHDFDTSVRLASALGILGGLILPQEGMLDDTYPWQEERFAKQIIENAHTLVPLMGRSEYSDGYTYRELFDKLFLDKETVGPILLLRTLKSLDLLPNQIQPDIQGVIDMLRYTAKDGVSPRDSGE